MEVTQEDGKLRRVVAAYLEEIRAFFLRNLEAGQAAGTISRLIDAKDFARTLLAILVLARSDPCSSRSICLKIPRKEVANDRSALLDDAERP